MKKLITYFSRAAMTLLLFVAGFNQASAGANWIGDSYINVNGTWYKGSSSANWENNGGAFNNHNFGIITSLNIGAQIQVHDTNNEHWANGSECPMKYKIDGTNNDTDGWQEHILLKYDNSGNNMVYQSGGSNFTTISIDISDLTPGEHTLRIFFGPLDGCYDSNNSNNYVAKFTIAPATYSVTGNQAGSAYWSTFYSNVGNYQAPEETQVFAVYLEGTTLTMIEIEDRIVKSGEGVVLKNTSTDNITMTKTETTPTGNFTTNSLTGTMSNITNPGNAYVLNKTNENGVGFYKLSDGGTIGANKAYLVGPASGGARQFFLFDEATGISATLKDKGETINEKCYDLQGRRVAQPTKGLYIVNGKKVIK